MSVLVGTQADRVHPPFPDQLTRMLIATCALGFGSKLVPSLVEAQEKLANVKIVPRLTRGSLRRLQPSPSAVSRHRCASAGP